MAVSVHERYRRAFAEAVAAALEIAPDAAEAQVKPAEPEHGDFAFPTFPFAKARREAPPAIAKKLAESVRVPGMAIAAAGPYLNARLLSEPFSSEVLDAVLSQGLRYGASDEGAGKTVVIDYSSPNIAKPIAFHHIRTTVIGHALVNLYRHRGFQVVGINYLGDWGKQFGLVAVGLGAFGDPARRRETAHLVEVYVKANARAEKNPAFNEQARAFFRRMEADDPEALALWKDLRELSIEDFKKIYARLGIAFESYEGESRYQGKMDALIEKIAATVGVKNSQGALIVDLPPEQENDPPILLKKNDGSTLYATRDLAAAIDRWDRFHFDRSLYVVATDQALHFRQFFRVLAKMGFPWAERLAHVNFGRIQGMSTRKGEIVLFSDVLDEARLLALEKVKENLAAGRSEAPDADVLAEQVGVGAVVFGDLKNRRTADYTFRWEEVLSFDGHTGPYLQYAHARTVNLLARGRETTGEGSAVRTPGENAAAPGRAAPAAGRLTLPEEQALIRTLARFPRVVQDATADNDPSLVARHLLDVAAAFSRWYTLGNQEREKRVLVEGNPALAAARLLLVDAVRITLATGLKLLGVPTPETM